MKIKMKSEHRKWILGLSWVLIAGVSSFFYTNCESYSSNSMYSNSSQNIALDEGDQSCEEGDPSSQACIKERAELNEIHKGFVSLSIAGSNVVQINPNDFSVNISGICNQDYFPKSEIYYRLVNNSQSSLFLSNNPNQTYSGSDLKCVNGQWNISIYLNENEVTYVGTLIPFQRNQTHTLHVEMVVRDSGNTLYTNPRMASDQVDVVQSLF